MRRYTMSITGMECGSCAQRVTNALRAAPGVTEAVVDLGAAEAHVTQDGALGGEDDLREAVEGAGCEVVSVRDEAGGTGRRSPTA